MPTEPKLIQAILSPAAKKCEVVVLDNGQYRKIDVVWDSKDPIAITDLWWSAVVGECDFQKGEEKRGDIAKLLRS